MKCEQNDCTNEATHTVYWPNQTTQQCLYHAERLVVLGNVMNIVVPVVKIEESDDSHNVER